MFIINKKIRKNIENFQSKIATFYSKFMGGVDLRNKMVLMYEKEIIPVQFFNKKINFQKDFWYNAVF